MLKSNVDYRQLRKNLFLRITAMIIGAIALIFLIYNFVLRGRFANWVVAILQNTLSMDHDQAQIFYTRKFRNYMDLLIVISVFILFFIIFRIYLNWFTKYFVEINTGIDALLKDDDEDVHLPSELAATEKKINTIKHILHKRKIDTQLAEQRKNDLVVYLAHDLKTPLTSVIGYLTLLRDEGQISDELREKYLTISLDKAERLEDLINEFFEITRFNLSNITLQYSKVNITRLLEQLVFEFKPMLLDKNLGCNIDVPPNLILKCDVNKMQRVFDNLLRNAVFYSFADTCIDIVVTQDNTETRIRVTNHGDTISSEMLERVFEQFYRLDTSRGTNTGGSGLGLAIAKEIVELHHGTITAESSNELITFTVSLPT